MFFKITSKSNGNKVIHYYNNITQEIYTEQGIPVCLAQDPRCQTMVNEYKIRPSTVNEPKSNKVRHLRIQMGLNCNFHCRYCNQTRDREATASVVRMPDSHMVNQFIKKLKQCDIQTNRITLWGGEPFVYYKLMKILVPRLRELYPTACISTISNGSLFDIEKAEWCIDNRIQLTISHDAHAFSVYRNDVNPLDDSNIINALKYYYNKCEELQADGDQLAQSMNLAFNVVITPDNCDIIEIDKYFERKFGYPVKWHFEGIVKCDERNVDVIHKFDGQTKTTLLTHMLITGTSDPKGPFWSIREKVSHLMGYIINKVNANDIPYPCDIANSDILAVDLNGNILACHGSDPNEMSIGSLTDLNSTCNTKAIPWMKRSKCANCPVLMTCLSGCCIVSDKDNDIMCENLKLWGAGLLSCAWYILFGCLIDKIEPADPQQLKEVFIEE